MIPPELQTRITHRNAAGEEPVCIAVNRGTVWREPDLCTKEAEFVELALLIWGLVEIYEKKMEFPGNQNTNELDRIMEHRGSQKLPLQENRMDTVEPRDEVIHVPQWKLWKIQELVLPSGWWNSLISAGSSFSAIRPNSSRLLEK